MMFNDQLSSILEILLEEIPSLKILPRDGQRFRVSGV